MQSMFIVLKIKACLSLNNNNNILEVVFLMFFRGVQMFVLRNAARGQSNNLKKKLNLKIRHQSTSIYFAPLHVQQSQLLFPLFTSS